MTSMDLALAIGGSLLVYWAVCVVFDDGGPAARKRRAGKGTPADSGICAGPGPARDVDPGVGPGPGPGTVSASGPGSAGMAESAGGLAPAMAARAWHEVLGVPADASQARILAAYRELVMREHPDTRVAISAEKRAHAEARLQEIEAACNAGLAARRA